MVGFASTGTRFTTRVRDENVWAFQSLTLILAGSRMLLAIQYTVNIALIYPTMRYTAKGVAYTALGFWTTTFLYIGVRFIRDPPPGEDEKGHDVSTSDAT